MINLLPIPSMYDFIDLYGFTIDIPYMDAMGNIHSHTQWEFTIKSDLVGSSSRKSCTLDLAAIALPHKVSIFGEIMSPAKRDEMGGARFSLHGGGC